MKKLVILFFVFPCLLCAQHSRQALLQPTCSDYNLYGNPRLVTVVQKYDQGNDINFQETYIFDSTGLLTAYSKRGFGGEKVTRYPLVSLPQNHHYTFDYDGDVLELCQYNQNGTISSSTHYIYVKGGNLAMTVEYTYSADSCVVIRRTVSYYDKHERISKVFQYTADELLLMAEKRKYDRRGNLVKRMQTFYGEESSDITVERRQYQYDRNGNWTRCHYSLNDNAMYTIERTIEY